MSQHDPNMTYHPYQYGTTITSLPLAIMLGSSLIYKPFACFAYSSFNLSNYGYDFLGLLMVLFYYSSVLGTSFI